MDDEQSRRKALDMMKQLDRDAEEVDARSAEAAAVLAAIHADLERAKKSHIEKMLQMNLERERALEASSKFSSPFDFVGLLRPLFFALAAASSSLTILIASKPDFMEVLLSNPLATSLGAIAIFSMICVVILNVLQSRDGGDNFVDIDEKLFEERVIQYEVEKKGHRSRINRLEEKLSNVPPDGSNEVRNELPLASDKPEKIDSAVSEASGFERYMLDLTRYLETHISVSEKKASLLLDKGTNYLWRGIVFYILSIVVWQVVTAFFKLGDFVVWGMISCSLTFLVVEFLAAWFLRQYKSFTDAAFNLVRVKSVFNRYFLSYLAIKEFSSSSEEVSAMRAQMLKVIEEDIKWLEPAPQKLGELNHMVAMFESVSGLVEKLKVSSKSATSTTASQ